MNVDSDQLAGSPRAYTPVAVYYEDADSVEYVRRDIAAVYRRIDELLTLILSMDTREPIGFRIKGFKNFYLRRLRPKFNLGDKDFVTLIDVVQEAVSYVGRDIFEQDERGRAYQEALHIAQEDQVGLREFPKVA